MTESEWLICDDPEMMLDFLSDRASDRKLRLFAAACCRRLWSHLRSVTSRRAVEFVESYADGEVTRKAILAADSAARAPLRSPRRRRTFWTTEASAAMAARYAATAGAWTAASTAMLDIGEALPEEAAYQCALLRTIFTPFRPLTIDPTWLTPTVVALAEAAYSERQLPSGELDPDRLAILSDALEETGAAGPLLGHLRGAGPHVRGDAAIDALLGKD